MSEIIKYEYDKKYYPQIRAVLNADKAPDSVLETAIEYCKAAQLDIMRKPVAIISFGGKNEIVFTIQAITTVASRAGWAGSDEIVFSDKTISVGGKAVPEWGYQVVYKMVGSHRVPFTGPKVYVQERYKNSWSMAGVMAMFQKCILAAALRIAFPEALAHAYTEDEMYAEYQPVEKVDNSGIEALKGKKPEPQIIEATATVEPEPEPAKKVTKPKVEKPKPVPVVEVVEAEPVVNDIAAAAIEALRAAPSKAELIELKDSIKMNWGLSEADIKRVADEFITLQKEKFNANN